MKHEPWLEFASDLAVEVEQAYEEGLDIDRTAARSRAQEILSLPPGTEREEEALSFHRWAAAHPVRPGYPYCEPSDWPGIRAVIPGGGSLHPLPDPAKLRDRIAGAWHGRVAGCLLGKPFEGWRSDRYYPFLQDTGQYPLARYTSFEVPPALAVRYKVDIQTDSRLRSMSRAYIDRMIEDDDTNYTVLGLKLVAEKGRGFTPEDVACHWLTNLPIHHVCTAERVAYRNLVRLIDPPESACYANPYREWIGAQIRADFYGYINPGDPLQAAEMAWRDGCISHVKNGIYGEMYVAAALSLALVGDDLEAAVRGALAYIPPKSRLHAGIMEAFAWRERMSFAEACDAFRHKWDENNSHHWCHTISNAQIVVLALLYGEKDFGRTICRAVDLLLDTDCNAATAGSILGAVLGYEAIPTAWTEPLHDMLETGVAGYNVVSIREMAERTMRSIG